MMPTVKHNLVARDTAEHCFRNEQQLCIDINCKRANSLCPEAYSRLIYSLLSISGYAISMSVSGHFHLCQFHLRKYEMFCFNISDSITI